AASAAPENQEQPSAPSETPRSPRLRASYETPRLCVTQKRAVRRERSVRPLRPPRPNGRAQFCRYLRLTSSSRRRSSAERLARPALLILSRTRSTSSSRRSSSRRRVRLLLLLGGRTLPLSPGMTVKRWRWRLDSFFFHHPMPCEIR